VRKAILNKGTFLLLLTIFISCQKAPEVKWVHLWIPPSAKFNLCPVVAGDFILLGSSNVRYGPQHQSTVTYPRSIDHSERIPPRPRRTYYGGRYPTVPYTNLPYHFYALDIETGDTMWEFNATGGGSTSAVVDADIVYFGDRAGYFYALEIKTGKTKWRMKVGDTVCSDPILHGDIIFFGASDSDQHFLCAMKKENGEILLKSLSTNAIQCSPAVTDEVICFADVGGQVYSIDSRNGEEKWKFIPDRITRPMITTDLIISDDVLYFGAAINTIYALDITSGALKWDYETTDKIRNNLVLDNGTIYFTDASYIHTLDIHTRRLRWKTMLPTGIKSAIAVINGLVFVGSNDGLWAIDAGSGRAIWNKALWKDEPPYGVILPATGHLAVTKTAIYWSTGYHIYAIERN